MTNSLTVEEVATTIEFIESIPVVVGRFIPSRYPYTYAYDYLKIHALEFGLSDQPFVTLSRSDCAALFHGNDDKDAICTLLADAYLREWGISKETGQ